LQYKSVVNVMGRDYSDEGVAEFVNKFNPILINIDESEGMNGGTQNIKHNKVTLATLKDSGLV